MRLSVLVALATATLTIASPAHVRFHHDFAHSNTDTEAQHNLERATVEVASEDGSFTTLACVMCPCVKAEFSDNCQRKCVRTFESGIQCAFC